MTDLQDLEDKLDLLLDAERAAAQAVVDATP